MPVVFVEPIVELVFVVGDYEATVNIDLPAG